MPYNSAATQMIISDSMVGRRTASRPHRKSTPGMPAKSSVSHVQKITPRTFCGAQRIKVHVVFTIVVIQ